MTAVPDGLLADFRDLGRDLYMGGLITSHGGNMSVRIGDRILITRRGSMLGRLTADDIVETDMTPCDADDRCSREIVVHRAIYAATDALAVVHAHPPYTIARSFEHDAIVPVDSEGLYVLGEVPVVRAATTIASAEAAAVLAEALHAAPVAVLRTHGPFAKGATLEEAFMRVSVLEASARILGIRERA
ncbi:MAG: aldolase [Coriobacteriia bacterium]